MPMTRDSGRRAKRQDAKQGLVRKDARAAAKAASPTPIQDHPMTNKQTGASGLVERLRELLANATPGPWVNFGGTVTDFDREFPGSMSMEWLPNGCGDGVNEKCDDDAELIVEAINALPELLDRLASLSPVPVDEGPTLAGVQRQVERLIADNPDEGLKISDWVARRMESAALTASRPSDDGWMPIETFESQPKGQANRVLICCPSNDAANDPIVGEAYYRSEGEGDDGWWWAGTSPGDYYASPVIETNNPPTHWRPLPDAPAAPSSLVGEK